MSPALDAPPDQASAAASQDSTSSDLSQPYFGSAVGAQSSSSNLSTATGPGTGLTSPASSTGLKVSASVADAHHPHHDAAVAAAMQLKQVQADSVGRVRTPELPAPMMMMMNGANGQSAAAGISAASPMAVDTPYLQQLHQASKRTASGTVKPSLGEVTATQASPPRTGFGHSRSASAVEGRDRKRISELSAQLKTRLSYAMVKVQHGWEDRSLGELEQSIPPLAPSAPIRMPVTPTTASRASHHAARPSTSSIGTVRPYASPYTDRAWRYAHSPDGSSAQSPGPHSALLHRTTSSSSEEGRPGRTSPRTYASFWARHERNPIPQPHSVRHHAHTKSASTIASEAPSLAPAAEVVPSTSSSSKRRSQHGRPPPQLASAGHDYGPAGSKARLVTPKTPRQNLLRMPSQQAEKDAVDTLLFMSSPNNSGNLKHAAQQGSPLRSDFPLDIRG